MKVTFECKVMSGINNKVIKDVIIKKWNRALINAAVNIEAILKKALIDQSMLGIKAFTDTPLWFFLMLPETLAELGFITTKPLTEDLLSSILETIFVKVKGGNKKYLIIDILDMRYIANATIHRSAGTGQLGQISWFVDWIIKGIPVTDYSFKQTGPPTPRSSRLAGDKAGLMIEGGMWEFPPVFRDSIDVWLDSNIQAIQKLVENNIRLYIRRA